MMMLKLQIISKSILNRKDQQPKLFQISLLQMRLNFLKTLADFQIKFPISFSVIKDLFIIYLNSCQIRTSENNDNIIKKIIHLLMKL